ncbi:MAG: chemotaxis protein CheB [Myxococcota bacterium]|nr:chemotaxis protein CheB [Myxococcota bacterium]
MHPVVAIGASAGGLEALEQLVSRLAGDSLTLVVVQHLAPDHDSLLRTILARCTPLPVVTITDDAKLERNVIFVAPPNREVTLEGDRFRLRARGDSIHRTIDIFFRSLAEQVGTRAIGVLLSGAGSDGTAGLEAIKAAGGITLAQDPSTAQQPSMPRSALDAGTADFSLPPSEIGDELMRLATHPFVARLKRGLDEESLRQVFDRLRRAYGVDFGGYKRTTIERRASSRTSRASSRSASGSRAAPPVRRFSRRCRTRWCCSTISCASSVERRDRLRRHAGAGAVRAEDRATDDDLGPAAAGRRRARAAAPDGARGRRGGASHVMGESQSR